MYSVGPENQTTLTAPGYGEEGNYGNGKIYVKFAHFKDCGHIS